MSISDPRTSANLRLAFPDLGATDRRRLARRSLVRRGAALLATVGAMRFDARKLCRRLTLEGWDHFSATEGRGLMVVGARIGLWRLAALVVALYRGPLHVTGRFASDRLLGRLAARLGHRLLIPHAKAEKIGEVLRAGGPAGLLVDRPAAGETVEVSFLGRTLQAATLVARASLESEAPVVPVFAYPEPRGTYRVVVREPIEPRDESGAERLTRRCWQAVEHEIRRRPEHWPWGS